MYGSTSPAVSATQGLQLKFYKYLYQIEKDVQVTKQISFPTGSFLCVWNMVCILKGLCPEINFYFLMEF